MAIEPGGLTPEPVEPVRASRPDPRVVLWRDSATILVFVVLALLGWQTFAPGGTGAPTESGDIPSGVVVGSLPPGMTLPPGVTFGPGVNPSLGIDATPTPIPVITLGPSPSPSPSPAPSGSPKLSPKPSSSPGASVGPTGTPPPPPTDTPPPPPTDTPPPPPVANFSWNEGLLCAVEFTNTSSNDTSWDWDFGDASGSSSSSPTHFYGSTGTYSVKLTINGGADSITKSVEVVGPCL
jgi:hypothetical protein